MLITRILALALMTSAVHAARVKTSGRITYRNGEEIIWGNHQHQTYHIGSPTKRRSGSGAGDSVHAPPPARDFVPDENIILFKQKAHSGLSAFWRVGGAMHNTTAHFWTWRTAAETGWNDKKIYVSGPVRFELQAGVRNTSEHYYIVINGEVVTDNIPINLLPAEYNVELRKTSRTSGHTVKKTFKLVVYLPDNHESIPANSGWVKLPGSCPGCPGCMLPIDPVATTRDVEPRAGHGNPNWKVQVGVFALLLAACCVGCSGGESVSANPVNPAMSCCKLLTSVLLCGGLVGFGLHAYSDHTKVTATAQPSGGKTTPRPQNPTQHEVPSVQEKPQTLSRTASPETESRNGDNNTGLYVALAIIGVVALIVGVLGIYSCTRSKPNGSGSRDVEDGC